MFRSELKTFRSIVAAQIRQDTLSWLSFALLLAWIFGMYWSNAFLDRIAIGKFDLIHLRAVWLAVEAVALGLLCGLIAFNKLRAKSTHLLIGSSTLCFFGTVILLFAPSNPSNELTCIAGVVITGLGSAFMLALSGMRLAYQGPRRLLVNAALALLCASVFDSLLLILPSTLQAMTVSLFPILHAVFFSLPTKEAFPSTNTSIEGSSVQDSAAKQGSSKENPFRLILRLVFLPLLVGVVYGLMQRLTAGAYDPQASGLNGATIVSFALSALFIGIVALLFDSRKIVKGICFGSIPVISIAYVLLPLFATQQEAARSLCIIGFNAFYFMVWALWANGKKDAFQPLQFVIGLTALVFSESIGSLLGVFIVKVVGESGEPVAILSLVVVYLLLMAALLTFNHSVKADDDELGKPHVQSSVHRAESKNAESNPSNFDISLIAKRYVSQYGLSLREEEVLVLLARGRNRLHISQALYISENTVRSHMKSIYRKLNVHSQQELIDLVEKDASGDK